MGNVCKRDSSSFTPRWAPRRSTPSRLSPAAILASISSRVNSAMPTLYTRSQRVSLYLLSLGVGAVLVLTGMAVLYRPNQENNTTDDWNQDN